MSSFSPDLQKYRPGQGYTILKYLGSGAWKSAFLGSKQGVSQNIALLCYHSADRREAADDLKPIFRIIPSHPQSGYLARFSSVFNGDDDRLWIAEELIPNSLKNVAPLNDVPSFTRIGRDLALGLKCIHDHRLVHRDIKLDNCGVNRRMERAKIFDLGSLTSEPGIVACTILTRPPELLRAGARYSYAGDIWALGATMFALSTGDYPFVTRVEVEKRSTLNEAFRFGKTRAVRNAAKREKQAMDSLIAERACRRSAERTLRRRITSNFGPEVAPLLRDMMSFNPDRRLTTAEMVARWESLADRFSRLTTVGQPIGRWETYEKVLEETLQGQLTLTVSQLRRAKEEWVQAKAQDRSLVRKMPSLDTHFARVARLVEQRRL